MTTSFIHKGSDLGQNHKVEQNLFGLLQEARFWVRILKEHALFIRLGLPCDREDLISEADGFVALFQNLQNQLDATTTLTEQLRLALIEAVTALIEFKRRLIRLLVQCELPGGSLYPLLIDHITREAVHFLRLLETGTTALVNPLREVLRVSSFWLRIMKEHVEFVIHLLDPSQRVLLDQARQFRETFSTLLEESRDLESMAEANPESFNTVLRFADVVVENALALRDFKATAHELAVLCRLLSIIPDPLLLDHIRREADKFIQEMSALRALIMQLQ